MKTDLKDKVVLVTGASGGIGSELVKQFAQEGAKVVVHYHKNVQGARGLCLEAGSANTLLAQADLSKEPEVTRLFETVEKDWGPVEVLIANAGVYKSESVPLYEMSLEQWQQTLSNNLTSMFLCAREFFKGVKKHGLTHPSAVLIGSTAGHFGEAGHSDYAASKAAAMHGFLMSLKNEIARIAPHGRVNAVCPGWTLTPMARDFSRNPDQKRKVVQTIPMKKVGRPTDVASSVLFLASSKLSGHLTGQRIFVSGGMEGRVLYSPDEINVDEV